MDVNRSAIESLRRKDIPPGVKGLTIEKHLKMRKREDFPLSHPLASQ
jgi:hypothetical protein